MQRYSKLFGRTVREAPTEAVAASHKLLHQAGFVRESTAGRYYFLPLGRRVEQKIVGIIREEMNKAGAQELITPVLHPLELWKETNRTTSVGFELMIIEDRRGASFVLGGTAEEMIIDVVRKFQISYKDLPFNVYQFSSKFRDELRARGGLLRVREFIMKDAYSFDVDEKSFRREYKNMWGTYEQIFDRLGLQAIPVEADNGYIGGDYSHEFVVESQAGESRYFISDDGSYAAHEDVARCKREEVNRHEKEKPLEIIKQPEWVQTMEDNEKHYGLPRSRFLKNVVYKNRANGEIIIVVVRGDLEVNKTKLEKVLKATGELEDATSEDLKLLGTKTGYVHSWGHKGARYIGDISLTSVKNFIGGQKEEKTDSVNVNYGRDFTCEMLLDIALAKDGFFTEDGKQRLHEKKGIEVGNIFQLGYHYTSLMDNAVFTDADGEKKKFYMGCYGIGVGRTLATIVEKYHDEKGILWPEAVAPYDVHFITLGEEHEKEAEKIIRVLEKDGKEVLWDDRDDVSAGVKFADADLIGIPVRIVLSDKSLKAGGVEVKRRGEEKGEVFPVEKLGALLLDD